MIHSLTDEEREALSLMQKENPADYALYQGLREMAQSSIYKFMLDEANGSMVAFAEEMALLPPNDPRIAHFHRQIYFYKRTREGFAEELMQSLLLPFMESQRDKKSVKSAFSIEDI